MSQLQQDNLFFDVQKDVCKILNDVPELSDVDFFPANDKDLETEITTALRKQGVCGIVLVNEADFQGFESGLNTAWQINDLVVQVIENPITNRSQQNLKYCGTAEDIGAKVSQVLGGVEYGHHQTFNLKKIEIGEDNNLLTSKVTFQCLVTTNLSSYVPPEHPEHRIPFASQEWVEENFASLSTVYNKTQIDNLLCAVNEEIIKTSESIPTKTSQLSNDSGFIDSTYLNDYAKTSYVDGKDNEIKGSIKNLSDVIPNQATSSNQLADKAFVNSSINNYAAFYLTKNANGDAFGTYTELTSATMFYYAVVEKTPTKNDYLVVLEDETKTTALGINPTTRYTYQGEWPTGQFEFQYVVNNTSLTQEQIDAINSGITKSIVDSRVIPSDEFPGYAIYAVNANYAYIADTANTATTANTADTALTATTAEAAMIAGEAQHSESANTANYAQMADTAISVQYYSETLLSGLTEDNVPVSFYILTKN